MTDLPDEIALIYAAAQTQQQQAHEALDRLQQHTQQLDALVRDTVRHAAVEALHAVHSEAERARVSLQEVHRAALPRVLWMTVGSAAAGLIATLILGACFVPSKEEIAQRQATLAALIASGAQAQLSRCTPPHGEPQLCIRVNTLAGPFGATHDYYLVHEE
jgi:superfamily II RNA helicase